MHFNKFLIISITLFMFSFLKGECQRQGLNIIELNLLPGIGTSGLDHDLARNVISINIFSGYSDKTLLLQISGINGNNRTYSGGLQIAGLANITGVNIISLDSNYEGNIMPYIKMHGLQLSGLANIVRGEVIGLQSTLGINTSYRHMIGAQLAGLSNRSGSFTFGVQLSGIYNNSIGSIDGVQVASINRTGGELTGLQFGLINTAVSIEGINSSFNSFRSGIQFGLVNIADKMNGFQFGIINISKRSQGTQIGLINIYPKGGRQAKTKDGTAIGLINLGDLNYIAVFGNEMFLVNYEISTGNSKNKRVQSDNRNIYVTNSLMFSHQSYTSNIWGIGYGLKKLFFNRSSLPGMAESNFFGLGLDFQLLKNTEHEIHVDDSFVTRLKFLLGKRIHPKLYGVNGFVSINYNAHLHKNPQSFTPRILSSSTKINDFNINFWPGFSVGILLH